MCGRFTLRTPNAVLLETFQLDSAPELSPRYNIAPTQSVPVVRADEHRQRELVGMRWGLVPSWAKDPSIGNRMINARSETVSEKPSFRAAWKRRRCLIVADGFYEWQKVGSGKQPYFIHRRDDRPFAFAGLWEHWLQAEVSLETCTILTTAASKLLQTIHDRSPVILPPEEYDGWLDPESPDLERLAELLVPSCNEPDFVVEPVSTRVNNSRYDRPDCIEPVKD
jgi:putative SOS response-associated peptidase YedK